MSAIAPNTKRKFQVTADGTLGWVSPMPLFASVDFGRDHFADVRQWEQPRSAYGLVYNPRAVTHVDWLRATATGSDILFAVDAFQDLLKWDDLGNRDTDFAFALSSKGLHGYPSSIRISVETDAGLTGVGSIAFQSDPMSSNCGVMIDLSGQFFNYLREACPSKFQVVYEFLAGYGFRLTRIDIALDLSGDYCRANGLTVPTIGIRSSDLFSSTHSRGRTALAESLIGAWGDIVFGNVSVCEYNPAEHSPKGLTLNLGSRKSPNFFRVYEKSKQIIALADLGEDHDLDKWAVRIEHEIKRDKDGAPIPLDILLDPDAFFGLGRPGLAGLFQAYASSLSSDFALERAHRSRFQQHVELSLKAKIFWGKRAYGSLLRTLLDKGFDHSEIFDMLSRSRGLKDFSFDLFDHVFNGVWPVDDLPLADPDGLEAYEFYSGFDVDIDRDFDIDDYML